VHDQAPAGLGDYPTTGQQAQNKIERIFLNMAKLNEKIKWSK
jgi:hypothetical protein